MNLPSTPEMVDAAQRIVWFEEPEVSLRDPIRFLAYALTYGMWEDLRIILSHMAVDDLREALDRAPPGIMDARSWAYWNAKIGRYPAPPQPSRALG